jgi:hypothetical protein
MSSQTQLDGDGLHGVKTDRERERILLGYRVDWSDQFGGMVRFWNGQDQGDPIGPDTFRTLLDAGYIDPDGRQNRSPTMAELCEYGETLVENYGLDVTYTGYMISPERGDARITVTGITVEGSVPVVVQEAFRERFGDADNFTVGSARMSCWYD